MNNRGMIPAGELRHRIEIQRPSKDRNSRGQHDGTWELVDFAWARIKTLSGTEQERARQQVGTATHEVKLRTPRNFDLNKKHRLVFRGRIFNVGFVDDVDELNSVSVCLVSEKT